jgi:Icc-related predicted phosphoesterase
MLDVNTQVRIDINSSLNKVKKLKADQKVVFVNSESDLQYSKYIQKNTTINVKERELKTIEDYKACKLIAEFLHSSKVYSKADEVYTKLIGFLESLPRNSEMKSQLDQNESFKIKIQYSELLLKLNKN